MAIKVALIIKAIAVCHRFRGYFKSLELAHLKVILSHDLAELLKNKGEISGRL